MGNRIPSTRSMNQSVHRYIGSDMDVVRHVADNMDAIDELSNLIGNPDANSMLNYDYFVREAAALGYNYIGNRYDNVMGFVPSGSAATKSCWWESSINSLIAPTDDLSHNTTEYGSEDFWKVLDASTLLDDSGIVVNTGNWSEVVGTQLTEQDRYKGYEYPDNSGKVYVVLDSVTLPITRPSTPDAQFYLGGNAKMANTVYRGDSVVDLHEDATVTSTYAGGREFTSNSKPTITNAAETLIQQTYRTNCNGFDVEAVVTGEGTALGTSDTQQSTWAKISNLMIKNQRYGIWKRYSIWEDYDNLSLKGNACGIRLARSAKQADNSNPQPTAGWNFWNDGYFHNVIKMNNVLCEGGEVGIYANMMCGSLDNITCQGQMTDGTSNSVLPTGELGTGIYLENGKDSSATQSWNNSIRSYYCENSVIGMKLKDRAFTDVNGYFYQPHDTTAGTGMVLDNSYVMMRGFCAQGTGKIADLTNGSVLVNEGKSNSGMSGTKYTFDATSQVYARGQCDLPFNRYTINIPNGSVAQSFTLPGDLHLESRYSISIIATYDGYLGVTGNATVYRHLGNVYSWEVHSKLSVSAGTVSAATDVFNLSDGFDISVVSNKITLTMKGTATRSIRLSVQIEEVCGTETVLNAPEILGVNV